MFIRPGLVYGRSCAIWSSFFAPEFEAASQGLESVNIPSTKGRPALVHVDDVASGLHRAVDKLPLLSGAGVHPVFDLIGQSESMRDIFVAVKRAARFEGHCQVRGIWFRSVFGGHECDGE